MTETKPAPSVEELKKLEQALTDGREARKTATLAEVNAKLAALVDIGFVYTLQRADPEKADGPPAENGASVRA